MPRNHRRSARTRPPDLRGERRRSARTFSTQLREPTSNSRPTSCDGPRCHADREWEEGDMATTSRISRQSPAIPTPRLRSCHRQSTIVARSAELPPARPLSMPCRATTQSALFVNWRRVRQPHRRGSLWPFVLRAPTASGDQLQNATSGRADGHEYTGATGGESRNGCRTPWPAAPRRESAGVRVDLRGTRFRARQFASTVTADRLGRGHRRVPSRELRTARSSKRPHRIVSRSARRKRASGR